MSKQVINILVSGALWNDLTSRARRDNRSRAKVARSAFDAYLSTPVEKGDDVEIVIQSSKTCDKSIVEVDKKTMKRLCAAGDMFYSDIKEVVRIALYDYLR